MTGSSLPKEFLLRRLHSLSGLFITLFLIVHLFTNSQAALLAPNPDSGFVKAVNDIHNLPYLLFIEIFLLAVPILLHAILGIQYLRTGESNSFSSDGKAPSLGQYPRNQAYTWQRITSWILLIGIILHVAQMRFIDYPEKSDLGLYSGYTVRLDNDKALYPLAQRLGVWMFDKESLQNLNSIRDLHQSMIETSNKISPFIESFIQLFDPEEHSSRTTSEPVQRKVEKKQTDTGTNKIRAWLDQLEKHPLKPGQVIAITPDFGTATLLLVRDTFKSPLMIALYTLFVLAAVFHAFNGLWTFMITWGVTLTETSQKLMGYFSTFLMLLVAFLGLAAIWGSYFFNTQT